MRDAFGNAARHGNEKAERDRKGRGESSGDSSTGGNDTQGRRIRSRSRSWDIDVSEEQLAAFDTPKPQDMPEPHWTELPLANEFREAARDRDEANADRSSGGRRVKPSRSARRDDRDGDDRDFERER